MTANNDLALVGINYFRQLREEGWEFQFIPDKRTVEICHSSGESISLCEMKEQHIPSRCQSALAIVDLLNSLDALNSHTTDDLLTWLTAEAGDADSLADSFKFGSKESMRHKRRALRFRRAVTLLQSVVMTDSVSS